MPRKTKEQKKLENTKQTSKKTATTKKQSTTKKNTEKKSSTTKKSTKTTAKASKTSSKKSTTNKKTSSKKVTKNTKKNVDIVEYYDLPYRYNQTVIKVLAQTPTTLFIYWDISDQDRKNFEKQYGENFFETTKPILIVYNNTLHYSFEVEINDFANSWYLHVADSKCDYKIELGRKPIVKNEQINTDYIYVTSSNEIESPNDKILFDRKQKMVYFRNVKTNVESSKSINTISFMQNMGKVYDIYDLYKTMYKDLDDISDISKTSNPSSSFK